MGVPTNADIFTGENTRASSVMQDPFDLHAPHMTV